MGGRGNIEAALAIVGEAPGGNELSKGLPFVGPSGDVLERCLPPDFNVNDQALILNAMQCCPPKSKSQTKDFNGKLACVNACRGGVMELLWAHPRKCLLLLGNWASIHVFGDLTFKVTKRRGEVDYVLDPVRGDEVPVVYAVHPASLFHGRGSIEALMGDIRKACEIAYGTEAMYGEGIQNTRNEYVDPAFQVLETPAEVDELRRRMVAVEGLKAATDLETSGFNPWRNRILCQGIYPGWDDNKAYVIPWRNMVDPRYAAAVDDLHASDGIKWIWQHGKFDRRFLLNDPYTKYIPDLHEDTLYLSYALNEASNSHDLEEQAKTLLGAPNYKDVLLQWAPKKTDSYEKVPEPVLFDYLAKDVKNGFKCWEINRERVRDDAHLEKLYTKTLMPAATFLTDIEMHGFAIDPNFVRINRHGVQEDDVYLVGLDPDGGIVAEQKEILVALRGLAGWDVNPNAPENVQRLLYDQFGLRLKGKVPTDTRKETLDKLPPHPAVKLVRRYRRLVRMLGTYVAHAELYQVDGIVHTTYKLHRTTTGRLASEAPNLQNIPREGRYRRMYRARPGYVLVEGDYNTAELRMLAALSRDPFLTGVFLDDTRNLHDEVSIKMYGPNFTAEDRIRAKAVNFGIPYGRSGFTLEDEFDLPPGAGQKMIEDWFAAAPGAYSFIRMCRSAPLRNESLVTIFGRKRRPGLVSKERLGNLQNEFANFFMQSTVSDFTLHAAMLMHAQLKKLGAHIVNLVHDSIVVECPQDPTTIREVSRIIRFWMEHTPTRWLKTPITFKCDIKIGTHWGLLEDEHKYWWRKEMQRQSDQYLQERMAA